MTDMQSKKILVVDDEQALLHCLELYLGSQGYEVATAENGIEALNKIKASNYDMIITNINMDGMNGIQLLREIAKLGKNLIKIVHTGMPDLLIIEEAKNLGCFAYIRKPASIDEMKDTIKNGFLGEKIENFIVHKEFQECSA